jgi:hypothetical protein
LRRKVFHATPRTLFDAEHGWALRACAQPPPSRSGLHGVQLDETVLHLVVIRLLHPQAPAIGSTAPG